jgi:hypothetical protein
MVTLTLPGDWLTVAPTGRAFKRLFERFLTKFARAWGVAALRLVWKLEFQRRGAPHLHLFLVPPTGTCDGLPFIAWLSRTWSAVCAHPDPVQRALHERAGTAVDYREGLRARDPKRLAVYFSKHGGAAGGKEYQHDVPEEWQTGEAGQGPGRFWGVRGLRKLSAVADVPEADFVLARRTLRRLSQRQAFYGDPGSRYPTSVQRRVRTVRVPRGASRLTGEVRYRSVTRARSFFTGSAGGFFMTNDGPALASALSRLGGLTA